MKTKLYYLLKILVKEKESDNSRFPPEKCLVKSTETFSLTIKGFVWSEVSASTSPTFVSELLKLYRSNTDAIESLRDGGTGTSFGGTYLRINTDIATMVNAKSVPTLTFRRKVIYILGQLSTFTYYTGYQNYLRNT